MPQAKFDEIEKREGKPMADILSELYSRYRNQRDVANELGVSQGTVSLWAMRFGLELVEVKTLRKRRAKVVNE